MEKRDHRAFRLSRKLLAGLLLAAAVLLPLLSGAILAVDLDAPCSITVGLGGEEYAEDMAAAGVVLDLYRLADLRAEGESFALSLREPYEGLELKNDMTADEAAALAQQAMRIAVSKDQPLVTGAEPEKRIAKTDAGAPLNGGLFLLLARGKDVTDYVKTFTDDDGNERLATIAYSDLYEYAIAPELFALPLQRGSELIYDLDVTLAAGQPVYDLDVALKPERSPRRGSLEIVKRLLRYRAPEEATFVFSVKAVYEGRTVYDDVLALSFTAAGQKSLIVEDLPIGAEVTVRELYSGACYSLLSEEKQTVVLKKRTEELEFVNDYNGNETGGHGVVNHFSYGENGGWSWTKLAENEGGRAG